MQLLLSLQKHLIDHDAEMTTGRKAKDSFWASEAETPLFDLYHKWIGTPSTNPMNAEKLVMFNAAKMMELSIINQLTNIGLLKPADEQYHFRIERSGIAVSGYTDGILTDGTPLEIKTFYGDYQSKELRSGKPKTSYLKQLAIYMDALNQDKGILLYMDRGSGESFEFKLMRDGSKYTCGQIKFDIHDVYTRWANLWNNHITKNIEPKSEYTYKTPISEINFNKITKAQITAARMGRAVLGDWQVKYSPYKDLIIQREGTSPGYSESELEQIKTLTKGYSSR